MAGKPYEGPVCFQDGWHYTIGEDGAPGERLTLTDGVYTLATEDQESWNVIHHKRFATVEME